MEDFLLKKQINEVSKSKSSKLKIVKFSLYSDDENLDNQFDNTKGVVNSKTKSDEASQYTEDIIENSKKSKSKFNLSNKRLYYSNDTVNTSLKISEIDVDNISNFEESDNEKNILCSGKKVEYFNKKDSGEISEMVQNSSKEAIDNIASTEVNISKKTSRNKRISENNNLNTTISRSTNCFESQKKKKKLFYKESYEENQSLDKLSDESINKQIFHAANPYEYTSEGNILKKKSTLQSNKELLVNSIKQKNHEEKSKDHQLHSDHQVPLNNSNSVTSKLRKLKTEEITPHSCEEKEKKSNFIASNKKISALEIERMVEEVLDQSVFESGAKDALQNLNIKIYWDLPTAHQLDTGSHDLSRIRKTIKEALEKEGLEWKNKVPYSSEECKIIKNNWEEFSELYGFEDPRVFFQSKEYVKICKYKERLKFKQFLAKGLPDRPLYSVYHKFIELYGYRLKGKWTVKEDMILTGINTADLKEEVLRKHIIICKVLERNWMSVHRRMQLLDSNKEIRERARPIEWTNGLMVMLLENLLKKTNSKHVEDLRQMHISDVTWKSISSNMGIIAMRLKRFWFERFYAQLFAIQPIYRRRFKIELIERFYNSHYKSWKEISWTETSNQMYSVGKLFIYKLFRHTVTAKVPREKWIDFRATVDYLYLNYLPQLKSNNSPDKLLTRLKYCPKKHDLIEIEDICEGEHYVEKEVKRNYFDDTEAAIKRKQKLIRKKLRACVKKKACGKTKNVDSTKLKSHLSSSKIKLSKRKQRNLENCNIYKQDEKLSEENYSDETNASNHDTNSISRIKKCKQESSDDMSEKEEFENNTYENESIITLKKSKKGKHKGLEGCPTDVSEKSGELLKKLSKKKHKNIEAEFIEREILLDKKRNIEFHNTLNKVIKKKQKNIKQDDVVSNEDLCFGEAFTEHNFLKNNIGAIECKENEPASSIEVQNDISFVTCNKSSKTITAFQKEHKERNEDLNANEETSSIYKKPSRTNHRKIKGNFNNILEEMEDKSLTLVSGISNKNLHFSEGNADMEYSFFRKPKEINATSTVERLNKRKHKFVQEDLDRNKEEIYTPKNSQKAHKKKKRNTEDNWT